ncbi:hypothetical protein [Agaribacter marinus]|uniref:Lipoprotein n=1 Tax=Agaribacter marinus TaxID=1431249 RepID=A0AA37SXY4_9ALTE|nr:hypothetical protein [Agaribacter marinus]GLR69746.1 hypothetical protein GCM10007852_06540 [Agaribacter marinus]
MKHLLILSFIAFISACGTTETAQTFPEKNNESVKGIDKQCADLVFARENNSIGQSNSGYFYAIAENAEACLSGIRFSPKHPDNALGMQLQALAVTNYVKSGDINGAKQAFESFRAKFPLQDLVYADFTSFVDTATALLEKDSLSSHQLAMLNINDDLRAEIQRQKTWLRK